MKVMLWDTFHPRAEDYLGFIPTFLNPEDKRPAREQFHDRYGFAGGWRPFKGFVMREDKSLKYPGDPAIPMVAETKLRNETIRVYPHAWVAIVQPDGTYEIARLD